MWQIWFCISLIACVYLPCSKGICVKSTLSFRRSLCIHDLNTTTVVCKASYMSEVIEFAKNITSQRLNVTSLIFDCAGYPIFSNDDWVSQLSGLGSYLKRAGVYPSKVYFTNCLLYLDTSNTTFMGHESNITELSITCCNFSGGSIPKFYQSLATLNSLLKLNFHDNVIDIQSSIMNYLPEIFDAQRCTKNNSVSPCFCTAPPSRKEPVTINCLNPYVDQVLRAIYENTRPNENGVTLVERQVRFATLAVYNLQYQEPIANKTTCSSTYTFITPISIVIKKCETKKGISEDSASIYRAFSVMCLLSTFRDEWTESVVVTDCGLQTQNISESYFSTTSKADQPRQDLYIANMEKKTFLDFSNNEFQTFQGSLIAKRACGDDEDCYTQESVMEVLNISNNRIADLGDDAFVNMPRLKVLNVSNNWLRTISSSAFSNTPLLEVLILSYNRLPTVVTQLFKNLTNLRVLDLSMNKLLVLVDGVFFGLKSLTHLDLAAAVSSKQIAMAAERNAFAGLSSLRTLVLHNLNALAWDATFSGLYQLQEASLTWSLPDEGQPDKIIASLSELTTVRNLTVQQFAGGYGIGPINTLNPCISLSWLGVLDVLNITLKTYAPCNAEYLKWLQQSLHAGRTFTVVGMDTAQCTVYTTSSSNLVNFSEFLYGSLLDKVTFNDYEGNGSLDFSNITLYDVTDNRLDLAAETELRSNQAYTLVMWASVISTLIIVVIFLAMFSIEYYQLSSRTESNKTKITWSTVLTRLHEVTDDNNKAQSNLMHSFYTSTTINGFLFITETRSKFEQIGWYICIAAFAGLMCNDIGNLVVQFRYDIETTVHMRRDLVHTQHAFTLCMPIEIVPTWPSAKDIRSILNNAGPCGPRRYYPLEIGFFRDLFLHSVSKQFTWEGAILDKPNNKTDAGVVELDMYLAKMHVSHRNLLRDVSTRICKITNMSLTLNTDATEEQLLNNELCQVFFASADDIGLTFYDDEYTNSACIRFPAIIKFKELSATATLTMQSLLRIAQSDLQLDLHGFAYPKAMQQGNVPLQLSSGMETTVTVQMSNLLQSLEFDRAGSRRCYDDCLATSRVNEIQRNCKCRPLMWTKKSDNKLPDCTLVNYIQCNLSSYDTFAHCQGAIPCEHIQYAVSVKTTDKLRDDQIHLKFAITNGLYVVTEENPTMTLSLFLSNLGGVLGLWLGASFMGLIHLFVCLCKGWQKCFGDRIGLKVADTTRKSQLWASARPVEVENRNDLYGNDTRL